MKDIIEKEILSLLSKNPDGLNINEIARHLGRAPNTISKYVYVLEARGELSLLRFNNVVVVRRKEK